MMKKVDMEDMEELEDMEYKDDKVVLDNNYNQNYNPNNVLTYMYQRENMLNICSCSFSPADNDFNDEISSEVFVGHMFDRFFSMIINSDLIFSTDILICCSTLSFG